MSAISHGKQCEMFGASIALPPMLGVLSSSRETGDFKTIPALKWKSLIANKIFHISKS